MSERSMKGVVPGLLLLMGAIGLSPVTALAEVDDPMRPAQATPASPPEQGPVWDLSSILVSENRRLAVINGELVKVGASVGEGRVERIEADRVLLRHGDRLITLTLRADLEISRSSRN